MFANPDAFRPFYTERVSVCGQRGARTLSTGALPACVLVCGYDDPLRDSDTATSRRRFSVEIRIADWPDETPPRTGDVVQVFEPDAGPGTRRVLHTLSVASVRRGWGVYAMEARE